ncbi:small GTP-binding domain protein [Nitzschia inconspicua]|uniref:Small GTP-binding domain protein n=1 Tax=Nitzschia inconspicua TaxID=303405 RepID=A0A9K3PCH4_9STRA|nr:small GTP-binding domain protein [Nitzschia inconspicua]
MVLHHILPRHVAKRIGSRSFAGSSSWQTSIRYYRRPLATTAIEQDPDDSTSSSSSQPHGLYRLLTQEERNLLQEQRKLTEASRQLALQVQSSNSSNSRNTNLDRIFHSTTFLQDLHLDSTFSVVIAGEFNAGKSTLINALLGNKLLETGALPTTDSITIVAAATESNDDDDDDDDNNNNLDPTKSTPLGVIVHSVKDLPLLEDLTLVDSPGTNSTWMDHTERTLKLLPSADLILFVTSAERPFSESERTLLQSIQAYRKSIVIVINKMDVLDTSGGDHGQEQKQAVVDFVTDKASELLGARPVVIPVSSKDALSAKLMEKSTNTNNTLPSERSTVYRRSNFAALESFLKESLTTQAKVKSKLSSPIGVAEGVMTECLQILKDERDELQVDLATLNIFQSQFEGWKKELQVDLALSRETMSQLVHKEGQRCELLLNRMTHPFTTFFSWTLMDTHRLEEAWHSTKQEVSPHRHKSLKEDLIDQVQETANAVATRGRAQGQAVIEYLGKRPAMKNRSLVGSVTAASRFEDTRKNLGERLSTVVESVLKPEHNHVDKDRLFHNLKQTALLSSSLEMGAIFSGLGIYFHLIDPSTGGIAMAVFAGGGGIAYVMGTSRIAQQYQQQWQQRAERIEHALAAISEKELDRVNRRILDGVAPYTRYVESEQQRIDYLQEQCERIGSAARTLRNRINKL